jgi:hypothetical protein
MTKKTFDLLGLAEQAIDAKPTDYPALVKTAMQIAALVPEHRYLAAPLLVIGKKLAGREDYLWPAIKAAEVAAIHAPAGSELKQQAVDTLADAADTLHKVTHASTPRLPTQRAAQRFMQKFKL